MNIVFGFRNLTESELSQLSPFFRSQSTLEKIILVVGVKHLKFLNWFGFSGLTAWRFVFTKDENPDLSLIAHEAKHVEQIEDHGGYLNFVGPYLKEVFRVFWEEFRKGTLHHFWYYVGRAHKYEREAYELADLVRRVTSNV